MIKEIIKEEFIEEVIPAKCSLNLPSDIKFAEMFVKKNSFNSKNICLIAPNSSYTRN